MDAADGLVLEAGCDDGGLVDAGSAMLTRELMRPGLELPIENAFELLHRPLLGVF
jgi:hypothetical protein